MPDFQGRSHSEGSARAIAVGDTDLFSHWAEIAIDHEAAAKMCSASSGSPASQKVFCAERTQFGEFKAALVAIAAASHALDALYGRLLDLGVIDAKTRSVWIMKRISGRPTPRRRCIFETVRRSVVMATPEVLARWSKELDWLFDEGRNPSVHPRMQQAPKGARHPRTGAWVSELDARFTAEGASRAVDLLLEITRLFVQSPKPKAKSLATTYAGYIDRFLERRTRVGDGP